MLPRAGIWQVADKECVHAGRNGVSTGRGALLLAVSRGRASEGVDFPDALARGVIMVRGASELSVP